MSLKSNTSMRSECIPWSNYQHTMHTAEITRKARTEVIVHKINKEREDALKIGLGTSVMLGADIVMKMDSDSQHNPAKIPKLVAPIVESKVEITNGSRYLNDLRKDTPVYHRIGQIILDKFTNIKGLKITDSQSGFYTFAASTIENFRFNAHGIAVGSEMLADAEDAWSRVKEVDIDFRYDVDGFTKKPVYHGLEVLLTILSGMILKKNILPKILRNKLWGVYFEDCIFYKHTCARSLI
jgi:glycosyltransferase involved in cell wall biosynthesis